MTMFSKSINPFIKGYKKCDAPQGASHFFCLAIILEVDCLVAGFYLAARSEVYFRDLVRVGEDA